MAREPRRRAQNRAGRRAGDGASPAILHTLRTWCGCPR